MQSRFVDDLSEAGAELFSRLLKTALDDRPRASIAISGGSTPWPVLSRLADTDLDWERIDVYQVDERVVADGHRHRNLTRLLEAFATKVPVTLHPMPVTAGDLGEAARLYAAGLPERFNVVHLGLGSDGHTASLMPGDPALEVRDRDVAITGEYEGHRRMTLTYPAIDRAESVVWLVSGEAKRPMLERLLAGDTGIPAGRVDRRNAVVMTDLAKVSK